MLAQDFVAGPGSKLSDVLSARPGCPDIVAGPGRVRSKALSKTLNRRAIFYEPAAARPTGGLAL